MPRRPLPCGRMSEPSSTGLSVHPGRPRVAARALAWVDRPDGRTLRLLAFGVIVAVLGTLELSRVHPAPWVIQSGRQNMLEWTLSVLDRGGPILTMAQPGGSQFSAAGLSDDQGLYLIVPWLTHLLGAHDPLSTLRWMALGAFAIPIALYPWLIRELSGSTLAGLISPFLLLIGLWLLPLADIYWVASWAILALLPVVLLLDRRWPRFGLPLLLGVLVLASVASAIRGQAGLAVFIAAVIVIVRRPWAWRARGAAIVLCALAYVSFSGFGMAAVRAERDHQLHGRPLAGGTSTSHPFWHTAYVGLGYLPNDWDIRYQDPIGYRDALRIDPTVASTGPRYNRILRERYFKLVWSDPWFTFRDYGAKLIVALRPAVPVLIALAFVGPWLLLVDRRRSRWRRDALVIGIAALLGLSSPFLATPLSAYLLGWLAAVLLAGILAFSALVAEWPEFVAYVRSPRAGSMPRRPRRVVGGLVVAALASLLLVAAVAPGIEDEATAWNAKPAPRVVPPPNATP
jgi:hypothetical protein